LGEITKTKGFPPFGKRGLQNVIRPTGLLLPVFDVEAMANIPSGKPLLSADLDYLGSNLLYKG